jgi:hypothetical protein
VGLLRPLSEIRQSQFKSAVNACFDACLCVWNFIMNGDSLSLEADHFRRIVALVGKGVAPAVGQLGFEHVRANSVGVISYDAYVREFLHDHGKHVGCAEGGIAGQKNDGLGELSFPKGL